MKRSRQRPLYCDRPLDKVGGVVLVNRPLYDSHRLGDGLLDWDNRPLGGKRVGGVICKGDRFLCDRHGLRDRVR
jgi:hypothetical protein